MEAALAPLRSIAPRHCKHISFLSRYHNPSTQEIARFSKLISRKDTMKDGVIGMVTCLLKGAGINLVIENLPKFGTRKTDNLPDPITAKSIHHTMEQFGGVKNAVVFDNHAYVWFDADDDAFHTHSVINNMMMGDKIITTQPIA